MILKLFFFSTFLDAAVRASELPEQCKFDLNMVIFVIVFRWRAPIGAIKKKIPQKKKDAPSHNESTVS